MNDRNALRFSGLFGLALALTILVGCESAVTPGEHTQPFGIEIVVSSGDLLASVNSAREVTGSLSVAAGAEMAIDVYFLDSQGSRFQLDPDDEDYSLGWTVGDDAVAEIEAHEGHLDLVGKSAGATTVTFSLDHEGHSDYESAAVPIVVSASL